MAQRSFTHLQSSIQKVQSDCPIKFTLYSWKGQPIAYYRVESFWLEGKGQVFEEPLNSKYDYQIILDSTQQRVLGSSQKLTIAELPQNEGYWLYKYQPISAYEYSAIAQIPASQNHPCVFAFAYAHFSNGDFNKGKAALLSTGDTLLSRKYTKALTKVEIDALQEELKDLVFNSSTVQTCQIPSKVLPQSKISVVELLKYLEAHKDSIILNLQELRSHYCRTGVKQVRGTRDEQGNLIEPSVKIQSIYPTEYVPMGSLNFSRHSATLNLLISHPVKLIDQVDQTPIYEIAGILPSHLKNYKSYTIVRDGELNIPIFNVKISNFKVFDWLQSQRVLQQDGKPVEKFDFKAEYQIQLQGLPLVSEVPNLKGLQDIFTELAQIQVILGLVSACLKTQSAFYLPEQVEEFKNHYLSSNLYLNFPTTPEYSDLDTAIEQQKIAIRNRYKIEIGNSDILHLGKLHSANKFLNRFYEVCDRYTGELLQNATCDRTLEPHIICQPKSLSSRLKITPVDELMQPLFDSFLGITHPQRIMTILFQVGAMNLAQILQAKWQGEPINSEQFIEALTLAKQQLSYRLNFLYQDKISPLIFFIGATGFLPEELTTTAQTAEQLQAKFPHLSISKDERAGLFFIKENCLIGIYPKTAYYSPS